MAITVMKLDRRICRTNVDKTFENIEDAKVYVMKKNAPYRRSSFYYYIAKEDKR